MRWLPVPRHKADELEAVISGRRSDSIASPEIVRLVDAGRQVGSSFGMPSPDPTWEAAFRTRLLTKDLAEESATAAPAGRLSALRTRLAASARVAVATGTASAMLGATGVVAAAAEAVPGDLLHPVKSATERVRLWASVGDVGDAHLHIAFAGERLDELEALAGSATRDQVASTLVALDQHVASATATASATGDAELAQALASHLLDQADRLAAIAELLPPSQLALVERSAATISALLGIDEGPVQPRPATPVPPATPTEPGEPQPSPAPTAPPGLPDQPAPTPAPGDLVPVLPGPLDGFGDGLEQLLRDLREGLDGITQSDEQPLLDIPGSGRESGDSPVPDLRGN